MSKKGLTPTDEEIKAMMDFDGLMKEYTQSVHRQTKTSKLNWLVVTGGFVAISVTAYVLFENVYEPVKTVAPVTKLQKATPESEQQIPVTEAPKQSNSPLLKEQRHSLREDRSEKKEEEKSATFEKVVPVYAAAEPIDGFPNLYAYFDRELKYPVAALSDSIQGVESVAFIIDKLGKPGKIEIQQSLGDAFDQEVIRLLQNMPPWKPATLNGEPVMSKQSVPFTFKITRKAKTKK